MLVLIAFSGFSWGTAYGQTAGPIPTPRPTGAVPTTTQPIEDHQNSATPGQGISLPLPQLPRTGGQKEGIEGWLIALLSFFSVVMLVSLIIMLRAKRRRNEQ